MVGVPRSKGCANCRRARVKCDEQKPECKRCLSRNKVCEGYPRTATFVHRSTDGTERRERVEETLPRMTDHGAEASSQEAAASFYPSPDPTGNSPQDVSTHDSTLDERMGSYQSLVARFMDVWLPVDPANRKGATLVWMTGLAELEDPDPPLRTAMHALAANRVGAASGNITLQEEGSHCYGEALGLLKSHLSVTDTLSDDQALSAARVSMMYEFYASPSQSVAGWNAHQQGIFNLATTRGPQNFDTPWRDALLLDIKNVNLINVTQARKRSSFLDPQWRRTAELDSFSEVEHKFYEIAFDFTATFGDFMVEGLPFISMDADVVSRKAKMSKFEEHAAGLAKVLGAMKELWPEDAVLRHGDFWDLESAVLAAYVIVLYTRACDSVKDIVEALLSSSMISESERWQLGSMVPKYSARRVNELAARALAAVEYCIKDEMGLYGSQKMLFPLRLLVATTAKEDPHYEKVIRMYRTMSITKSIKHAEDLDKRWGMGDLRPGRRDEDRPSAS